MYCLGLCQQSIHLIRRGLSVKRKAYGYQPTVIRTRDPMRPRHVLYQTELQAASF